MATVNIRRNVDDKFYRYKMPSLLTKVEGRGNGIKTVIPNMEDVAHALARPPTYPTKFFGCELGAQTTFANDRYIVNGSHTAERLRELLDTFIEKFVLCPSCKNPETELIITGKGNSEAIHRDCKACGRQNDIDMRHKLTTFILRNPPKKDKGKKGGKQMTATANVGGPMVFEKGTNGNGNAEDGSDDGAQSPDIGLAAAVPTSGTDIDDALGRSDPILGNPDAAEEVSKKLEALNVDEDDEEDANSPYTALGSWLKENKTADDAAVISKIKELEIVGKHKVLLEIGQHLFTDEIAKEIGKRVSLLQVLVQANSEKHQKSLLGGIERLLALSPQSEQLLAAGTTSKVLMALYQADILEEEVVRQWGTHVSKKYVDKDKSKKVRKSADAFLKWLDEAEESSEEEDED